MHERLHERRVRTRQRLLVCATVFLHEFSSMVWVFAVIAVNAFLGGTELTATVCNVARIVILLVDIVRRWANASVTSGIQEPTAR